MFDITRFGINQSTVTTAVSEYLKIETENIFKPYKPVRRVYNFVDLELFRRKPSTAHRANFARPDQPIYIHVSNFRPVKRILDIIQIFARVRKSVDAVLLMVGEGPLLREARELAGKLGISKHVKFLGKQEDIVTLLSSSDVLLFPSETESFGLAPLEAMACEMPVIASESGGIPEVVDASCGFLAPVGDTENMAKHAIELGLSADLRAKMGKAGRLIAESKFHSDIIIPQYEAIYQEAMTLAGKCA